MLTLHNWEVILKVQVKRTCPPVFFGFKKSKIMSRVCFLMILFFVFIFWILFDGFRAVSNLKRGYNLNFWTAFIKNWLVIKVCSAWEFHFHQFSIGPKLSVCFPLVSEHIIVDFWGCKNYSTVCRPCYTSEILEQENVMPHFIRLLFQSQQ